MYLLRTAFLLTCACLQNLLNLRARLRSNQSDHQSRQKNRFRSCSPVARIFYFRILQQFDNKFVRSEAKTGYEASFLARLANVHFFKPLSCFFKSSCFCRGVMIADDERHTGWILQYVRKIGSCSNYSLLLLPSSP